MTNETDGRQPAIQVVADDREAGSAAVEALRSLPEVELILKRMRVGDYLVEHRWVFERKTLLDFAASITDGRLFAQAGRLARAPELAAVILEGRGSDLAQSGVSRESLQGALISLSLIYHLPVLRALDGAETARLLLYAGRQIRRHELEHPFRPSRRLRGRRRRQLYILQGLPGIGPDRAARLLDHFGWVEAVITAPAEQLEAVTGIGAKTAAAIREAVGGNPLPSNPGPEPG